MKTEIINVVCANLVRGVGFEPTKQLSKFLASYTACNMEENVVFMIGREGSGSLKASCAP